MAWTKTDVDALKKVMGQGVTRVKNGDKEVEYHPFSDQQKLLNKMEAEAGTKRTLKKTFTYSKGLQ